MHIRTVHVCPVALYVVQFYHHKTISDRILRRRRVFFSPSAAERLFFTCYVYIYKRWWQCQRGDYIDNGEKNKGYISKLLLYWLHKSRHTAIDAPMGTGKNTRLIHDKHTPRVLWTDVNCRSFLFVARLDFNICTYCKKGKLSVRVNYRSDTMYCVIKLRDGPLRRRKSPTDSPLACILIKEEEIKGIFTRQIQQRPCLFKRSCRD